MPTGVRYQFIGKLFERRPNFRILGLLLFGQLTSTAALQLLRSLAGLRVSASLLHQATDSAKSTKASVRPIIVLQVGANIAATCLVQIVLRVHSFPLHFCTCTGGHGSISGASGILLQAKHLEIWACHRLSSEHLMPLALLQLDLYGIYCELEFVPLSTCQLSAMSVGGLAMLCSRPMLQFCNDPAQYARAIRRMRMQSNQEGLQLQSLTVHKSRMRHKPTGVALCACRCVSNQRPHRVAMSFVGNVYVNGAYRNLSVHYAVLHSLHRPWCACMDQTFDQWLTVNEVRAQSSYVGIPESS